MNKIILLIMCLNWPLVLSCYGQFIWSNDCARQFLKFKSYQGHLKINNSNLKIKYTPPVENKETFILLNGLVYESSRWDNLVDQLQDKGFGVVQYERRGQWDHIEFNPKNFSSSEITTDTFTSDLHAIIEELPVGEKFSLVGLSYGASVAAQYAQKHPEKVSHLFFVSPLVKSLDLYDPSGQMLRNSMRMMSYWGPMGEAMSQSWYDMIYKSFYKNLSYPENIKKSPLLPLYESSLFEQAKIVKDFNLHKFNYSGSKYNFKVHLMLAEKENPLYIPDQLDYWKKISEYRRGHFEVIKDAPHDIVATESEKLMQAIQSAID